MNGSPFLVFDLDGTLIDGYSAIEDALSYAMERLGLEPLPADAARTVVVGDMEVDFEFARAGCRVVLIPGGSRSREELAAVAPDAFLDRIADLPAWLAWGSTVYSCILLTIGTMRAGFLQSTGVHG